MALGTQHDFAMHRGDSRKITGTVVDAAGTAVDLTGVSGTDLSWVLATLDTNAAEPAPRGTALVTKTLTAGITVVSAVAGTIEIALDEADTTGRRAPLGYYHELQLVLGGETTTVMFGIITLSRDIVVPGP